MSSQVVSTEIRFFVEFLEKCLGRKVLEYSLKPLTKPGDNYGSIMQLVAVKVVKDDQVSNMHFHSSHCCLK